MLPNAGTRLACGHGFFQTVQFAEHMHHAFAVFEGGVQRFAQRRLLRGQHVEAGHGQLDVVLLEAVDARKACGGQELAIDAQVGVAAWARPVGQLGVDALAVDHQRRQQADVLAFELGHELCGDAVGRLRLHGCVVVHAVLDTELDVEQAQEVPDLGGGADSRLATAARQALLDRHGRRDAVDRVHFRAASGLHDGARIGVEAFQVAALAFVEQDVERERGLA